jgi:hypothetical protein
MTTVSRSAASPMRAYLSQAKTVLYRRPVAALRKARAWGLHAYFCCDAWAREMEAYAWSELRPVNVQGAGVPLYFMTGRHHWFQTAFCLHTFLKHTKSQVRPVVLDDGTLDEQLSDRLSQLFPGLTIVSRGECDQRVFSVLPPTRYVRIHGWRSIQPLFRKLTDLHAGANEWRVFFDSDMLFFETPSEIDAYLRDPAQGCLFQTDCHEAYGYSRNITEPLCGHRLPECVNIGIFSLNGSLIDWDSVESWLGRLEAAEGRKYNVTQCVSAMLMASHPQVRLDRERYLVLPSKYECDHPGGPNQHYVAESKPWYFRYAWRRALEGALQK